MGGETDLFNVESSTDIDNDLFPRGELAGHVEGRCQRDEYFCFCDNHNFMSAGHVHKQF